MLTCKEYLEMFSKNPPAEIHVNGLDLLSHTLQGDMEQSWYKDPNGMRKHLFDLQEQMEEHSDPALLDQVLIDNLTQKRKWIRYDSEDGDLDIERFLQNRNNDTLMFDNYWKENKLKPSMTLILDIAIPYGERRHATMESRHKKIYTMAVQAFQEGRPCRIIALWGCAYPEISGATLFFITIKDFNDPIFSGIWGAFKTNRSTNCFLNVVMDYFIGTGCAGNGSPIDITVTKFIPREEFELIDPKRLHY